MEGAGPGVGPQEITELSSSACNTTLLWKSTLQDMFNYNVSCCSVIKGKMLVLCGVGHFIIVLFHIRFLSLPQREEHGNVGNHLYNSLHYFL